MLVWLLSWLVCYALSSTGGAVDVLDYEKLFGLSDKTNEQKYICADIVFVLDTSCSVRDSDKRRMLAIVENVVKGAKVDETITRFGLVLFDFGARKLFGLNNFKTSEEILEELAQLKTNVKTLHKKCQATYTWEALELVRTDEDLLGNVSRYDTLTGKERKRVLVLMTDGEPYKSKKTRKKMRQVTTEMGRLNDLANITTIVVHFPRKGVLEPIPLLDDLVSKPIWKYEVSKGTNLVEMSSVFFQQLALMSPCDYRCRAEIDLCFVLDRSDSISSEDLQTIKEFLQELGDSFVVEFDENTEEFTEATVGVSSYNAVVYQHSLGPDCKNNECVRNVIEEIPNELERFTETDDALENVLVKCLAASSTRGNGVPKVAILATDGNTLEKGASSTNSRATIEMANQLRNKGINIEIIGLPNEEEEVEIEEWQKTASHFVFDLRNNTGTGRNVRCEDLKALAGTVARKICEQYFIPNDICSICDEE